MPLLQPLWRVEQMFLVPLDQVVPLGADEDSLRCLWLAQLIVGRDDLLDGALCIVLELDLPIV